MKTHLSKKAIKKLKKFSDLSNVEYEEIVKDFSSDEEILKYRPDGICQIDPRNNLRTVYSQARAKRPHDTGKLDEFDKLKEETAADCPVCQGKTTGIIDVVKLSKGFTFINKNLYPIIFYEDSVDDVKGVTKGELVQNGFLATGGHYLQWPSNYHNLDYYNMELDDIAIVMKRLAVFEEKILHCENSKMPLTDEVDEKKHYGYIGIIKNAGSLVGGSLVHGHLQMIHTNILPRTIEADIEFMKTYNLSFSEYIQESNPKEFLVKNYADKVEVIVPYFMKRPLDCFILVKNFTKSYLHDLDDEELFYIGNAMKDVTYSVCKLMPKLGRKFCYNVTFHEGPIGGFYIEVLPYTQEIGGYEQLGIYICQGSAKSTAEYYREYIK